MNTLIKLINLFIYLAINSHIIEAITFVRMKSETKTKQNKKKFKEVDKKEEENVVKKLIVVLNDHYMLMWWKVT